MRLLTKLSHLPQFCQARPGPRRLALLSLVLLLGACTSSPSSQTEATHDSIPTEEAEVAARRLSSVTPASVEEAGMDGDYVYFAEVATFTPCTGGEAMPVVPDSVSLQLERRYLEEGPEGPQPMLVVLVADTVEATDPSGRMRAQLRVREILAIMPREHCP